MVVRARCLRRLQGRCSQRQIVPLHIQPEPKVPAVIPRHARTDNPASAADKLVRRPVRHARARTHVELPVLVIVRFRPALFADVFGRDFLAAARFLARRALRGTLARGFLGLALIIRLRLIGSLLRAKSRNPRQDHHQHCRRKQPRSRNPWELSNHSFSSRCRAQLRGRTLGARKRLGKSVSAWSRRDALAAGRLHITNFDALSARVAARVSTNRIYSATCEPSRVLRLRFPKALIARIMGDSNPRGILTLETKFRPIGGSPNPQSSGRFCVPRRAGWVWHRWPLGCEDSVRLKSRLAAPHSHLQSQLRAKEAGVGSPTRHLDRRHRFRSPV